MRSFSTHVFLVAAALVASARPAHAESLPQVLVVPVTRNHAHLDALRSLAADVDEELDARQIPHLGADAAAAQFVAKESRDPIPITDQTEQRVIDEAELGLAAMTNGKWTAAQKHFGNVLAEGERALESANRNAETANVLWRACLFSVSTYFKAGELHAARAQALDCRFRSPGATLSPDDGAYPKAVHDIVAEAQQFLDRQHTAPIRVESSPPDCAVYLNGLRRSTKTPYEEASPARKPYLVQVDCDSRPARVHTVLPGDDVALVKVDSAFETAVHTESGMLVLNYDDVDAQLTKTHLDKLRVLFNGQAQIIRLSQEQERLFKLERTGHGSGVTALYLPEAYSDLELSKAVKALLEPALEEVPAPRALTSAQPAPPPARLGIWQKVVGGAAITAGAVALSVGAAKSAEHAQAGNAFRHTGNAGALFLQRRHIWSDGRAAPYVYTALGAGLLTAGALGLTLAVPSERVSWWVAAPIGVLGAALLTSGAVTAGHGSACSVEPLLQPPCVHGRDQRDRGGLLMLASLAPLSLFTEKLTRTLFGIKRDKTISLAPLFDRQTAALQARLRW